MTGMYQKNIPGSSVLGQLLAHGYKLLLYPLHRDRALPLIAFPAAMAYDVAQLPDTPAELQNPPPAMLFEVVLVHATNIRTPVHGVNA